MQKKCDVEQKLPGINRRHFLKIFAATAGVLAGGRLLQQQQRLSTVQETRLLMGTVINLALFSEDEREGRRAMAATFAEMERLIRLFDHRLATGPLGRLNRQGALAAAPPELVALLEEAIAYGELTQGAFDVTVRPLLHVGAQDRDATAVPVDYRAIELTGSHVRLAHPGMSITLDGIAKGRVVDGASTMLRQWGYQHVLVEAGGDLMARGQRDGLNPWRVGIPSPRPRRGSARDLLARLAVTEQALATSGDYMNSFTDDYSAHHIVDPRSRRSPAELASVTVTAPTATVADALSTAVMVLGVDDGLSLLERLPHVAGLLVTKQMEISRSHSMIVDPL